MRWLLVAMVSSLAVCISCAQTPRLRSKTIPEKEVPFTDHVELTEQALELYRREAFNVYDISYAIQLAAGPYCNGDAARVVFGSLEERIQEYEDDPVLERVAEQEGLDREWRIAHLVPGAPMERAGARVGDRILLAHGKAARVLDSIELYAARRQHKLGGYTPFTLLRDGDEISIEIEPLLACAHRTALWRRDALGIWGYSNRGDHSDSRGEQWISITRGLIGFAGGEDEIAIAIAHEYAHRLIEESPDHWRPTIWDLPKYDGLHLEVELEADRLGLELARKAGFDVSGAARFWERLAVEQPLLIEFNRNRFDNSGARGHGRVGDRLHHIRAVVEELSEREPPC